MLLVISLLYGNVLQVWCHIISFSFWTTIQLILTEMLNNVTLLHLCQSHWCF